MVLILESLVGDVLLQPHSLPKKQKFIDIRTKANRIAVSTSSCRARSSITYAIKGCIFRIAFH